MHWDDDDWSAPERIEDQVARLERTGHPVTGYRTMPFTDGREWWEYEAPSGIPHYVLGTSLCYRRDWWMAHRFDDRLPTEGAAEDNDFVYRAVGHIATAGHGGMMYATIHPGNTSPRTNVENWRKLNG